MRRKPGERQYIPLIPETNLVVKTQVKPYLVFIIMSWNVYATNHISFYFVILYRFSFDEPTIAAKIESEHEDVHRKTFQNKHTFPKIMKFT